MSDLNDITNPDFPTRSSPPFTWCPTGTWGQEVDGGTVTTIYCMADTPVATITTPPIDVTIPAVPEPGTWALLLVGLMVAYCASLARSIARSSQSRPSRWSFAQWSSPSRTLRGFTSDRCSGGSGGRPMRRGSLSAMSLLGLHPSENAGPRKCIDARDFVAVLPVLHIEAGWRNAHVVDAARAPQFAEADGLVFAIVKAASTGLKVALGAGSQRVLRVHDAPHESGVGFKDRESGHGHLLGGGLRSADHGDKCMTPKSDCKDYCVTRETSVVWRAVRGRA